MRRVVTCAVAAAVLLGTVLGTGTPAHAGKSTDIALGLASFAVFNQVVRPFMHPHPVVYHRPVVYETVVTQPVVIYQTPAPVYVVQTPPQVYVTAAPVTTSPTVVQYPHGRYELRWQGSQYVWVWIPTVPPPPAIAPY